MSQMQQNPSETNYDCSASQRFFLQFMAKIHVILPPLVVDLSKYWFIQTLPTFLKTSSTSEYNLCKNSMRKTTVIYFNIPVHSKQYLAIRPSYFSKLLSWNACRERTLANVENTVCPISVHLDGMCLCSCACVSTKWTYCHWSLLFQVQQWRWWHDGLLLPWHWRWGRWNYTGPSCQSADPGCPPLAAHGRNPRSYYAFRYLLIFFIFWYTSLRYNIS